jgi:hypothetical protein
MTNDTMEPGQRWRKLGIAALGLGWLAALVLWWALWSEGLEVARRFAVVVASVTVLGAIWMASLITGWLLGLVGRAMFVAAIALGLGLAGLLWGPWRDLAFGPSLAVLVVVVGGGAVLTAPIWIWRAMTWKVTVEASVDVVVEGTAGIVVDDGEGPEGVVEGTQERG